MQRRRSWLCEKKSWLNVQRHHRLHHLLRHGSAGTRAHLSRLKLLLKERAFWIKIGARSRGTIKSRSLKCTLSSWRSLFCDTVSALTRSSGSPERSKRGRARAPICNPLMQRCSWLFSLTTLRRSFLVCGILCRHRVVVANLLCQPLKVPLPFIQP